MKKSLIALSVASLLLAGLSGCSLEIRDATPTPPPSDAPVAEPETGGDDTPVSGGGFTNGDCTGQDVTIDQDNTNAVLSGDCGSITISAEGVFVTVESAESITVAGTRVDVVVSEAVGAVSIGGEQVSYNGGDVTTLDVPGSSISVIVNDVGSVSVGGSGNFITWSSGAASATDTGSGNTVVAP